MDTIFIGKERIELESIDSTNNYAARLLEQALLSDGAVIMAEFQTAGRGQRGAVWDSQAGQNLMFSVVFTRLKISVREPARLVMITALALRSSLEKLGIDQGLQIKWPNDILVHKRKIAGMLIESNVSGGVIHQAIVGVGLNVNQSAFDFTGRTSLCLELGEKLDRGEVLDRVLSSLEAQYLTWKDKPFDALKRAYMEELLGVGLSVPMRDDKGPFVGTITDVQASGRLVVDRDGWSRTYDLKELSFEL